MRNNEAIVCTSTSSEGPVTPYGANKPWVVSSWRRRETCNLVSHSLSLRTTYLFGLVYLFRQISGRIKVGRSSNQNEDVMKYKKSLGCNWFATPRLQVQTTIRRGKRDGKKTASSQKGSSFTPTDTLTRRETWCRWRWRQRRHRGKPCRGRSPP